jgi:hypothetical protein
MDSSLARRLRKLSVGAEPRYETRNSHPLSATLSGGTPLCKITTMSLRAWKPKGMAPMPSAVGSGRGRQNHSTCGGLGRRARPRWLPAQGSCAGASPLSPLRSRRWCSLSRCMASHSRSARQRSPRCGNRRVDCARMPYCLALKITSRSTPSFPATFRRHIGLTITSPSGSRRGSTLSGAQVRSTSLRRRPCAGSNPSSSVRRVTRGKP